jgi:hypothetical protein
MGSSIGAWITQRHQGRSELLAKKIFHREQLYPDFISESARLLVDAAEHNVADPKNLIPAYALLSRIRLSSSPDVLATAEAVIRDTIDTYAKPNLTPEQIEFRVMNGDDPFCESSARSAAPNSNPSKAKYDLARTPSRLHPICTTRPPCHGGRLATPAYSDFRAPFLARPPPLLLRT